LKLKNEKLDGRPDLPEIQREILDFWRENKTFEKSVKNKKEEVVFYDGPPFPTGKPHHGTVLVSFIKDMVARYWTMRGFSVPRTWGWDCHGLPIETQAEAVLGIKGKNEIEKVVGVEKFNEACFNIVSSNNDAWKAYVDEMARWVDYDGAYKTMDVKYMESVLWTFKQLYDKGLIYRDYRVTPYCTRCETSLSISDTRESDSTRPRQDPCVIVKFLTKEKIDGKAVYLTAWTTTPWTLPSNMALAVGNDIEYAYVSVGDEIFVAGVSSLKRYEKIFGKTPEIVKKCKGSDLVGAEYAPLFEYFADKAKDGAFRVISADFIDSDEGIGIVHIAPAFGEDDYWAGKANGVPLVNPVDGKGLFTSDITDFAGRQVIESNRDIIRFLRSKNAVVDDGTVEHNYPHCWRCRQPLIYKAMDAWYFSIDKIKDKLIAANEKINWVPETVKDGRFGNWLNNARDWNISRNRYWSTPIPVWECEDCKDRTVLGSIDEIYKASGVKLDNLHKHHMDKVTFKCPHCGGTKRRIPEVLDCWFETGAVPYAQKHYPFENKEWFESHYPCDFVVEYTGQIRCWFYYLHVIAVALFDKPAFKNCIVHGTVLAQDGKKLSKSSKNYTDPMELMKKYGTDAFRLYMYQSSAMLIGDLLFDESGLQNALQQILLPFWNACGFYTSYALIDGFSYDESVEPNSENQLDKWILAKLYDVQKKVTERMDKYKIDEFIGEIVSLIDGLTNWYIRRSRRRFWGSGFTKDKRDAYETLSYVLVNACKLLAPVAPILSEKLYKHLTDGESVHLTDWCEIPERYRSNELLDEIDAVQKVIHLARSIRNKNNIKNRQPLKKLQVAFSDAEKLGIIERSKQVICEELNVKEIEIINDVSEIAEIQYQPNFAALGAKYGSKLSEIIKAIRGKKFEICGNNLVLEINGEKLTLSEEDVLINYNAKSGLHVMSGGGIVAALDLTVTEELKREGVARELVRNIQDARKQLSCDMTEKIAVRFKGEQPPEEWLEYICGETLSNISDFDDFDAQCEIVGNSEKILVGIKRLKK
jgi:isoleucyl-tRNA synthetase